MIAFDLACSNGHRFECWFKDSHSFEEQNSFGIIQCPICNDHQLEKVISTFSIQKHSDPWEEKEEKIDFPRANQALQIIPEVKERMGLCGESGLALI